MLSGNPFGFTGTAFAFLTALVWLAMLLVLSLAFQGLGNLVSKQRKTARKQQVLREVDIFDHVVVLLLSVAALAALALNLPFVWQQWSAILGTSVGLDQCWDGFSHMMGIQIVAALMTGVVAVLFSLAAVFGFVWLTERHKNHRLLVSSIMIFLLVACAAVMVAVLLRDLTVPGVC